MTTSDATEGGLHVALIMDGNGRLRIAVDYSARDAIVAATSFLRRSDTSHSHENFVSALSQVIHAPFPTVEVDLLIRTSGEKRLSDFLLWECAYAELLFCEKPWPDFGKADLTAAVAEFRRRERRFGAITRSSQLLTDRRKASNA